MEGQVYNVGISEGPDKIQYIPLWASSSCIESDYNNIPAIHTLVDILRKTHVMIGNDVLAWIELLCKMPDLLFLDALRTYLARVYGTILSGHPVSRRNPGFTAHMLPIGHHSQFGLRCLNMEQINDTLRPQSMVCRTADPLITHLNGPMRNINTSPITPVKPSPTPNL